MRSVAQPGCHAQREGALPVERQQRSQALRRRDVLQGLQGLAESSSGAGPPERLQHLPNARHAADPGRPFHELECGQLRRGDAKSPLRRLVPAGRHLFDAGARQEHHFVPPDGDRPPALRHHHLRHHDRVWRGAVGFGRTEQRHVVRNAQRLGEVAVEPDFERWRPGLGVLQGHDEPVVRPARQTDDATLLLLPVKRLAQRLGAHARQVIANLASAQVQPAGLFGRIEEFGQGAKVSHGVVA